VYLSKEVNVNMTLTVLTIELALKINAWTHALCTVLVARVDFVKPLPIGQCVAAQVDGQVTLTLNVTNMNARLTETVLLTKLVNHKNV